MGQIESFSRQPLDTPINPIPENIEHSFEWVISENEKYRYVTNVTRIRICGKTYVFGNVRLTKNRLLPPTRFWHRWKTPLKMIWSVTTSTSENLIMSNQVRESLWAMAVNKGINPSDLLLDKSISPILEEVSGHYQRIRDLTYRNREVAI